MAERNPSKQRRAAENKAAREALAARRVRSAESKERAAEDRARRQAEAEAEAELEAEAQAEEAAATTSRATQRARQRARYRPKQEKTESGRPSRSAPTRPAPQPKARSSAPAPRSRGGAAAGAASAKRADAVPDAPTEPGWRGFLAHVQQVPGGKAVMFALIFAVVAAGTLLGLKVVQQSGGVAAARIVNPVTDGKTPKDAYDAQKVTHGVTLIQAAGPMGIVFAAVPVIVCGYALDATRRPNRRRAFTIAAFALGIYVVFFSFIGIFYFFSMAGLFFAAYQARKADPPVRAARPRRPAKAERKGVEED